MEPGFSPTMLLPNLWPFAVTLPSRMFRLAFQILVLKAAATGNAAEQDYFSQERTFPQTLR
jgi:hypothetical protein